MARTEKHFSVRAELGDAKFIASVRSADVDKVVQEWELWTRRVARDDARAATCGLVSKILMNEEQNKPDEAQLVTLALVWLAATGQHGERLLPLMRAGDMAIGYAITRLDATNFKYHRAVDEKTGAALGISREF